MKKILYLLIVTIVFCSCTEYQKALKSDDPAKKYESGMAQYEMENYTNAISMFFDTLFKQGRDMKTINKIITITNKTLC